MSDVTNTTLPERPRSRAAQASLRTNRSDGIAAGDPAPSASGNSARQEGSSLTISAKTKEGLVKKLQLLTNLAVHLDTLVFAELCVMYYMDISFFRLAIRWMAQSLFISPRAGDTVFVVPNFHIFAIAGPNIFCFLLHLINSLPQATEMSRGYLHGGVLFDFVGQKPPSSRFTFLLLDIIIFLLQSFLLSVNMERDRVRAIVNPPRVTNAAGETVATAETVARAQDLDSEERGVRRGAATEDENGDVEMGPMERASLLGRTRSDVYRADSDDLADFLRSGNVSLSRFDIIQALKTSWRNHGSNPESAAAYTLQSMGYNATLAALAAQRRARRAAAQQAQT